MAVLGISLCVNRVKVAPLLSEEMMQLLNKQGVDAVRPASHSRKRKSSLVKITSDET